MTTVMNPDTLRSKYVEAYNLMLCNLLEADSPIRVEAIENGCLDQLLEIRDDIIHFLETERATIQRLKSPALDAYLGLEAPGTTSDYEI